MGKLNSREIDAPFDISRLTACNGLRITKSNEGYVLLKRRGGATRVVEFRERR